jgi:hypothetical protein
LIVDSEENAFGKATATWYKNTHPRMLVTPVDKTKRYQIPTTNQKCNRPVGGQLFLVRANQQEVGTLGAATDIHVTVGVHSWNG